MFKRTSMFAAPTMVKRLVECQAQCNPDHIRTIIWGGAPMYAADARGGNRPIRGLSPWP
jgi:long-chain acyl-CoA synthetase